MEVEVSRGASDRWQRQRISQRMRIGAARHACDSEVFRYLPARMGPPPVSPRLDKMGRVEAPDGGTLTSHILYPSTGAAYGRD